MGPLKRIVMRCGVVCGFLLLSEDLGGRRVWMGLYRVFVCKAGVNNQLLVCHETLFVCEITIYVMYINNKQPNFTRLSYVIFFHFQDKSIYSFLYLYYLLRLYKALQRTQKNEPNTFRGCAGGR